MIICLLHNHHPTHEERPKQAKIESHQNNIVRLAKLIIAERRWSKFGFANLCVGRKVGYEIGQFKESSFKEVLGN